METSENQPSEDAASAEDALNVDTQPENDSSTDETAVLGEATEPGEATESGQTTALRLWPAVLIVVLLWAGITIPGMLRPLTFIHFVSMQGGPPLGFLAIMFWWLLSRSVPMEHRLAGIALIIVTFAAGVFFAHSTLNILLLVYGLPTALTLLVLGLVVGRNRGWSMQGWIGYLGFLIIPIAAQFVRVNEMDAAFAFSLVSRSTPTAEEVFLAEMEKAPAANATTSSDLVLPTDPAEVAWSEFRGPQRDGKVRNVNFPTDWDANPLKEEWRKSVGPGWASFTVVGPLLFTQDQRGEKEAVVAYNANDGSTAWTFESEGRFEASMGGIGPRATPTYRDGKLYVTGGNGKVFCLEATTGDLVWTYDLIEQLEVPLPAWGFSSSPLVHDDLVIVFAGGGEAEDGAGKGTAALSRETGELVWSSGDGSHGYSSPHLATLHGKEQILVSSNRGIRSFEPSDGSMIWKHDWEIGQMARVTQPIVVNSTVYMGTGYGNGTMRFDVDQTDGFWTTEEAWIAPMKPYFNDAVFLDGHLYGFDGKIFMCIDAETGDKAWKKGRYGHGQALLIEDQRLLLITTEHGDLVLVKATPDGHDELARMKSVTGITWNHPVIANGKLYVRNAQEMVCYSW